MKKSTFLNKFKHDFEHIAGSSRGELALVEATDKNTGDRLAIICLAFIAEIGGDCSLIPVAKMLTKRS